MPSPPPDLKSILDPLDVPQTVKADTWDHFHAAANPQDFRTRFDMLPIPRQTKAALWDAKFGGSAAAPAAPAMPTKASDLTPNPDLVDQRTTAVARAIAEAATRPQVQPQILETEPAGPVQSAMPAGERGGIVSPVRGQATAIARPEQTPGAGAAQELNQLMIGPFQAFKPAISAAGYVADSPLVGAKQAAEGIEQVYLGRTGREKAAGASQVLRGGLRAATPAAAVAALAAPIEMAVALGAGEMTREGSQALLKKLGVPEEYADLAGDVVGIAAGVGSVKGYRALDAAAGRAAQRMRVKQILQDRLNAEYAAEQGRARAERAPKQIEAPKEEVWETEVVPPRPQLGGGRGEANVATGAVEGVQPGAAAGEAAGARTGEEFPVSVGGVEGRVSRRPKPVDREPWTQTERDVIAALQVLGSQTREARRAVQEARVEGEPPEFEPTLRRALGILRRPPRVDMEPGGRATPSDVVQPGATPAKAPDGELRPEAGPAQPVVTERGPARQMPTPEEPIEPRPPKTEPAYGREVAVAVPGEPTTYRARYVIREAEDVAPSHNAFSFEPNPRFEYQNERDYRNNPQLSSLVVEHATPGVFNPEFLTTESPTAEHGAPIWDPRGNVLGGNSRAMTLGRVYQSRRETGEAYKSALRTRADNLGLSAAEVDRFARPVLGRELVDQPDQATAARAIADFNKRGAAALSPGEQAVADGKRLTTGTVAQFAGRFEDVGEESTLAQALRGENGAELVNALVRDGVVTPQERNGLLDERGVLTPEAKARVAHALVGRMFESPAQYNATAPEVRGKLERVAPQVLRLEGRPEWDVTPQVREAVAALADARAHGIRNLEDLARQGSLTGGRRYSPEALAIAETLQQGPLAAARAFRQFANDEALSREGAQAAFFEPPTRQEAFQAAFGQQVAMAGFQLSQKRNLPYIVGVSRTLHARMMQFEPLPLEGADGRHVIAMVTNPNGMEYLYRMTGGSADAGGMYWKGAHVAAENAGKVAAIARAHAQQFVSAPPEVLHLAEVAERAARMRKSLVVVVDHEGLADDIKETALREELDHALQSALVEGRAPGTHLGPDAATMLVRHHPLGKRALAALQEGSHYPDVDPGTAAAEVAVRLMRPGGHAQLDLAPGQARSLAAYYVRSLRSEHGRERPREIAKRVFDALRSERSERGGGEPGTLPGSVRPGGRRGPGEGSGPDLSAYRPPGQDQVGYGADLGERGLRPSGADEAPGLFTEGQEAQSRAEGASGEARLLGEQLTAQFKSGTPARAAKLRPPENRSLFDEPGAEQGDLFGGPELQARIPGLSAALQRLHDSSVRTQGIAASSDLAVSRYLEDLRTLAAERMPDKLPMVDDAIEAFHDGAFARATDYAEGVLGYLHQDELFELRYYKDVAQQLEKFPLPNRPTFDAYKPPRRMAKYFQQSMEEVRALKAKRDAALAELEKAKATPGERRYGQKTLEYFTGERDLWAAAVNQRIDRLRRLVPEKAEQEGLALMREFRNRPGELEQFRKGTHPDLARIENRQDYALAMKRIGQLGPAIEKALHPTERMLAADEVLTNIADVTLREGQKLGFLESRWTAEEYVSHMLHPKGEGETPEPMGERLGRAMGGKIGKFFAFGLRRSDPYPTLMHAVAHNVKPKTLNAFDAFTLHGDQFARARATYLLENQLADTGVGVYGVKENAPKGWVPLARHSTEFRKLQAFKDDAGEVHLAEQRLWTPPWMEKALRPVTDPNFMARVPGFVPLRHFQAYTKAIQLGLSFFHATTLNYMALASGGPKGWAQALRADRDSPEFITAERDMIAHGGTSSIQEKTQEAWRALTPGSIPTWGEIWRAAPGVRHMDQAAQAITDFTFGNLQRRFKVTDYQLHWAAWIGKYPDATPAEQMAAKQSITKYVNAAFGGLHWENLHVNRMSLEIARAVMLAPDWTFSNIFHVKYVFERGTPAGRLARAFWIRTMVGGVIATQLASLMFSGRGSPRPTEVYMGRDEDGNEVYQNIFFKGAPGDLVNVVNNVRDYGAVQGVARTMAGKGAPLVRTGIQLATNRNYLGEYIVPKGMNPVAGTVRGAAAAVGSLAPVPLSVGNFKDMLLGPEAHRYKIPEFVTTPFSGNPPKHIPPPGWRMGPEGLEEIPEPEQGENSVWQQMWTGRVRPRREE